MANYAEAAALADQLYAGQGDPIKAFDGAIHEYEFADDSSVTVSWYPDQEADQGLGLTSCMAEHKRTTSVATWIEELSVFFNESNLDQGTLVECISDMMQYRQQGEALGRVLAGEGDITRVPHPTEEGKSIDLFTPFDDTSQEQPLHDVVKERIADELGADSYDEIGENFFGPKSSKGGKVYFRNLKWYLKGVDRGYNLQKVNAETAV